MELPVYDLEGVEIDRIPNPVFFRLKPRRDVVHRVFVHQQSHTIQPQGRAPTAGKASGAEYFGVGLGMARIPRIKSPPLRGRGAVVTMARGGRRHHATTPQKRVKKKINEKERSLAIAYAASATAIREIVETRGHRIKNVLHIPLIVAESLEDLSTTGEFRDVAGNLGLMEDLERVKGGIKRIGGKARLRGRGIKRRVGPLLVYGEDKGIRKAVKNVQGFDAVSAGDVSVVHLAPGGSIGRLTVWTRSSIEVFEERLSSKVRRMWMNV